GDAFDAETERPASPDFGVVTDVFEHLRMHHAAARDLQPFLAHLARQRTGEINLEARFGVAEVMRAEANPHVAAEQVLEDELHGAFEVADRDASIDIEPFDLLERRVVRGVGVVAAIDPAGHDDPDWRLLLFHHPDLDRG